MSCVAVCCVLFVVVCCSFFVGGDSCVCWLWLSYACRIHIYVYLIGCLWYGVCLVLFEFCCYRVLLVVLCLLCAVCASSLFVAVVCYFVSYVACGCLVHVAG